MSVIRKAVLWVVAAAVVLAAGAYAVLATPPFKGFRQSVAQGLVADILDRPAIVEGDVSVAFEGGITVVVEDIKLPPDDVKSTPLPNQFIETIDFVLPYSAAIFRTGDVSSVHLSGIQIDFGDITGSPSPPATQQSEAGLGVLVRDFLISDLSSDLHVSNVFARYRDRSDGWDEELHIDQIVSRLSDDRQFIEIDVAAEINGTKLASSGRVQSVRHNTNVTDLPFEFQTSIPGAMSRIEGILNVSGSAATMDANYQLQSASIGQLLDDFGLERTIDGTLTLNGGLKGPLDGLRATSTMMDVTTSRGDTIKASGEISDISSGDGVALDFSVAFPDEATTGQTENILDMEIIGFRGHLGGAVEHLSLSETTVQTNVANVELEEIGPISIGRVVKDDEDRLGLQDIKILDGPPERPTLQLEGKIDDLLGFKSVMLDGLLDFPVESLFGARPVAGTGELGRFSGSVVVSDEGGSLGIDHLDGAVVDSKIWSLTLAFVLGEIRELNEIVLDADLAIPNVKAFAAAVGQTVDADGEMKFAGDLLLRDEELELRGDAKVIHTEISGHLTVGSTDGRQQISGSLQSEHVKLPDLAVPIELFKVDVPKNVDLDISEEIKQSVRIAVDLDFAKITGDKDATGKLIGHLKYADEIASLSEFTLEYLGGIISGDITGDFHNDAPAYAAKVRVKKWRMGRLLGELGLRAPISGTVYLNVDLQAQGESPQTWVKTMTGNLTASLWGGRVPGRILDLTGLNLVSWLAAKKSKSDGTRLVCVVVPVRLKQGVANGRSMIIETENVQIVGGGTINFRNGGLKLAFMPRPKKKQFIDIVTPFRISGTFSNPSVRLEGGKGSRVFAEVVSLPFNLIGQLFTGNKPKNKREKPCVLPKNTRPK